MTMSNGAQNDIELKLSYFLKMASNIDNKVIRLLLITNYKLQTKAR